jgi:hypothetical protein
MQSFSILKQVVHIESTGILRVIAKFYYINNNEIIPLEFWIVH